MKKLVECVPNFSEGRDRAVLDAISRAIESVEGARLLDVDPGAATNRTVFTFVGSPEAALEAAFRAIRTAAEKIDMRRHHGEHPRLGATDVCPLVPLAGSTMADCVQLARDLVKLIAEVTGFTGEIRWDTSKPDGQPRRRVDPGRAAAAFGFRAEVPFAEGLRRTVDWYLSHRAEAEARDH